MMTRDSDPPRGMAWSTLLSGVGLAAGFVVQTAVVVIWGASLTSRVSNIEQRGSPQAASLESRVIACELRDQEQSRALVKVDETNIRLSAVENKLNIVQERQNTVVENQRGMLGKIDAIIENLRKHESNQK
jgi:hypothetical protein